MRYLINIILSFVMAGACAMAQNFALPRPPQEMKSIPERAGYVAVHYWDNVELAAIEQSELEQAFVNYLSVFPLAQSDSLCRECAVQFMAKADSAGSGAAERVLILAEKYLFNADSPMLNEEYFIGFVRGAGKCGSIGEDLRRRIPYWDAVLSNNRCGSHIENFCFETADGALVEFSSVPGKRLLLLYDTDCSDCRDMIASFRGASHDYTVVAVAVNCTVERFRNFLPSLPSDWIAGWDSTGMINGEAFAIRHLPDLYLVDSYGVVLAKHRIDNPADGTPNP